MLVTIANRDRIIYKFFRKNGRKYYEADSTFYPYYYEVDENGKYISIYNNRLKKVFVSSPKLVAKQRSKNSFEADVLYTDRYYVDKIHHIEKTNLKIGFLDIEVQSEEFPNPKEAKYPISSVSVYDYSIRKTLNFFLPDFDNEKKLLNTLTDYLLEKDFDLLIGFNMDFDWEYLNNRWSKFYKSHFSSVISTIKTSMYKNGLFVPANTVIADYREMYRKMFPHGIGEYSLDYILEYEFGEGKKHKIKDFNIINEELRQHNIDDVVDTARIEDKHHLIDYYDEIRRIACCSWYDVLMNSKMIDILNLRQAKEDGIVLPNKKKRKNKETFEGADRESIPGYYKNVRCADVSSCYPTMLINFNISPENYSEREGLLIDKYRFIQKEGLLVRVAKKLGKLKDKIKEEKKNNPNLYHKYMAIKGLYNSIFGTTKFSSNRLYSLPTSSSIAFLARDMLYYIEKKANTKLIFRDTDSIVYQAEQDFASKFNRLAEQWAKEKYNKDINIIIDAEKPFVKLFNKANCHYIGQYADGSYKVRGMEMKRSSSSKYQAWFQETLIKEFIFKEKSYTETKQWVDSEKERIKTLPLIEISFPAKVKGEYKDYLVRDGKKFSKKQPIFVRALKNSKLKKRTGELFYWLYITTGDKIIAIDDDNTIDKNIVDWQKMIQRNIENVWITTKEVMGWSSQKKLF